MKTRGIRETVYVHLYKVLKNVALINKMKTCSLGESNSVGIHVSVRTS